MPNLVARKTARTCRICPRKMYVVTRGVYSFTMCMECDLPERTNRTGNDSRPTGQEAD